MVDATPTKRTRMALVETAARVFYAGGIKATGVDAVIEAAGISKPTMYRYFRSKEELTTAALSLRASNRQSVLDGILHGPGTAERRLLGVFTELVSLCSGPGFRGCALVVAAAELATIDSPARIIAAEHKRRVGAAFEQVARQGRYCRPAELARGLLALVEGATILAALDGDSRHAVNAKQTARTLLHAHRPSR